MQKNLEYQTIPFGGNNPVYVPGFTDEKIHLYLATGLVAGESKREADEFLELAPVKLSRALAMIEQGEIQDAKTALALLFAAGFRLN